jgi:copper(I)-binding protein
MSIKRPCKPLLTWLFLAWVSVPQAAESIRVEDAWARETPPGVSTGAGYVTLINEGSANDRLIAARSGVSERVELHTHRMEGGMIMMRQVESIDVDAGGRTVLEPGGTHLMLIGLKQPLVAGQRFPLTLEFEKGGKLTSQFEVRRPMN